MAANRAHVPKFGNWENDDNVPYTVYFDNARKGRTSGGKMINPNDPQENPDLFPNTPPQSHAFPPTEVGGRGGNGGRRNNPNESSQQQQQQQQQRYGGRVQGAAHAARQSLGSEHSLEKSPHHPHYQEKAAGRGGSGSPAWEGKASNDGSHGTPGRSKLKPTRNDESPDRGAAVPRFGDWDENNPSSADNYTHIFNKVREERHGGSPMVSAGDADASYRTRRKQKNGDNSAKVCCFPWGGK